MVTKAVEQLRHHLILLSPIVEGGLEGYEAFRANLPHPIVVRGLITVIGGDHLGCQLHFAEALLVFCNSF